MVWGPKTQNHSDNCRNLNDENSAYRDIYLKYSLTEGRHLYRHPVLHVNDIMVWTWRYSGTYDLIRLRIFGL